MPDWRVRLCLIADPEDATKLLEPATYLEFGQLITAISRSWSSGLVCFFIVKGYNKMKAADEENAGPSEVDLLTEIRAQLSANNS